MPVIPRRYGHFLFGFIQSGLTCGVAAAISSAPFFYTADFANHWIKSWVISWAIMTPVVLLAAPLIQLAVQTLVGKDGG